jgi:HD superfamily phosphohydrolase YqeK
VSGLPDWAVVTPARRAHVERVAALVASWAQGWRTPEAERSRWLRAVYLHDALRDAPVSRLKELSPLDWGVAALLHGPAAAEEARRRGEADDGVLTAVRYHTVGWAEWDRVGQVLYLADYLEPGRPFAREERAVLAAAVPGDLAGTLRAVVRSRITWVLGQGWHLHKETVDFWNALVAGD